VCVCARARVRVRLSVCVRVRVCGGARPPLLNQSLARVMSLAAIWLGVGVESGLLVVRLGCIVGRDFGRGWDRGEGNHHVRDGAGHTSGVPLGTHGLSSVPSPWGHGSAFNFWSDGVVSSVGEFPTCRCVKNQGSLLGFK